MLPPGGGVLESEIPLVQLFPVDVERDRGTGVLNLHIQHHLLPLHSKNHSGDRPEQSTYYINISIYVRPECVGGDSLGNLIKDADMKMSVRPVLVCPRIDLPHMLELGVVDRQGSLRALGRH